MASTHLHPSAPVNVSPIRRRLAWKPAVTEQLSVAMNEEFKLSLHIKVDGEAGHILQSIRDDRYYRGAFAQVHDDGSFVMTLEPSRINTVTSSGPEITRLTAIREAGGSTVTFERTPPDVAQFSDDEQQKQLGRNQLRTRSTFNVASNGFLLTLAGC